MIEVILNIIKGSFGRVRLARNKKTGEYFAMKILKKADIIKLKQVDHVISENTILADIDHPFLVHHLLIISIRLDSRDFLKTPGISTSSWTIFLEGNYSHILEQKGNLIQNIRSIN